MDYTTLVKTIKAYVENDFPETIGDASLTTEEQINTFIQQAEQRIYNAAQLLDLRKNSTGTATANVPYVTVPDDWMSTFSLAIINSSGVYSFLSNKDVNFIRECFPDPTETGIPTHYGQMDKDTIIFGPTPDQDYDMELHYFYYPETIVTAGNTWLGDNFDSVLLYGSLLEAYTLMKGEEDVMANYRARYDESLAMLKQLNEGKIRQDTYRTEQVRYPVR